MHVTKNPSSFKIGKYNLKLIWWKVILKCSFDTAHTVLTHWRSFVCALHVLFWVDCNCQDNGLSNLHLPLTQQMYIYTHKQHTQPAYRRARLTRVPDWPTARHAGKLTDSWLIILLSYQYTVKSWVRNDDLMVWSDLMLLRLFLHSSLI